MDLPNGQKSKLDKLEKKLYSVEGITSRERPSLKPKKYNLSSDWQSEGENFEITEKKKISFFTVVLFLAFLFFAGSMIYAGFIFYGGTINKDAVDDVDIKIVAPVSISAGENLSYDVIVTNNNKTPIELVDLFVEYPEGTKNPDKIEEDLRRITFDLGNINPGEISRETLNAVFLGEEGTMKNVNFTVQYRIPNSNAIFEKKKNLEIALTSAPIRLAVSGLQEISAGQEINFDLKLNSNSDKPLKNVLLKAEYPFGFKYIDSDLKPKYENNIWLFEEIKPNEEINIKLKGLIEGQNNEDRVFRFNVGLNQPEKQEEIGVLFTTVLHETKIQKSFIGIELDVNKNKNSVVPIKSNEINNIEITFTNNTNDALKNVRIDLELAGSVIDKSSISATKGFYKSIDNTIVWDKTTDPVFENIPPRSSQKAYFKFKTLNLVSGANSFKEPQVDFNIKAEGIRISSDNKEEKIVGSSFRNLKVISDVLVNAYTNYSEGPFQNSGPIPPKVDNPTTYTVELSLANSSNNIENAKITGSLPQYVAWKNKISPNNEKVSFDPVSKTFIWDIGNVPAGAGFTSLPRKVYFQVELLPSLSQKNSKVDLLNNLMLNTRDTFTRTDITKNINPATTLIKGLSIGDGHQMVTE